MNSLEVVILINLVMLGLWVGLRVMVAGYNRQLDQLERILPPPGEDETADRLRSEADEARILGPLWGRTEMAALRVRIHAWANGVELPPEPIG